MNALSESRPVGVEPADALDPVVEEGEVGNAPIDGRLVLVDVSPLQRFRV